MNNAPAILKSLVIYAICVPLAVIIGYMLTDPVNFSTFAYEGILALVLVFPLLLRWHYPLLLFSFNASIYMFFIKGRPEFWIVMVALSLGISLMERAMSSQMHFIRVPQITWSLVCMLGVIFMTAKLTGGIGLRAFGSEVYGGKKYVVLIIGYFELLRFTAQPHPAGTGQPVCGAVHVSGVTNFVGDLMPSPPRFSTLFSGCSRPSTSPPTVRLRWEKRVWVVLRGRQRSVLAGWWPDTDCAGFFYQANCGGWFYLSWVP